MNPSVERVGLVHIIDWKQHNLIFPLLSQMPKYPITGKRKFSTYLAQTQHCKGKNQLAQHIDQLA